jgi:hypothetical protein
MVDDFESGKNENKLITSDLIYSVSLRQQGGTGKHLLKEHSLLTRQNKYKSLKLGTIGNS